LDPARILDLIGQGDEKLERELCCPIGNDQAPLPQQTKVRGESRVGVEAVQHRVQAGPASTGLLVSRRAFGYDRRDTIADAYFTEEYERQKADYLK